MNRIIFITGQEFNLKTNAGVNRLDSLAKGLGLITKDVRILGLFPGKSLTFKNNYYRYINLSGLIVKNETCSKLKNFAGLFISTINLTFRLFFKSNKTDIFINYQMKFWYIDFLLVYISKIKKYNTVLELTEEITHFIKSPSLLKFYEKHILAHYTMCYVISSKLQEYVSQFGVPVKIINMTVDYDRFANDESGIDKINSGKYIAYCGSLNQHKDGILDLIHAFYIISKKYPDIKLKLAGSSTPAFKKEMKELISNYSLDRKIEVMDYLDSQEIVSFLKNSTIVVLARPNSSQAEYGFPTKLGEYLASGVPVIVTDTGDISKILKNEKDALIIYPGDYKILAQSMEKILDQYDKYKEMGINGKKAAETIFDYKIQSKKLLKFLNTNAVN